MTLTIPFLVTIAVKVALLTIAAALVGVGLRRQSASLQHGLRITVLALSLIVPLAALVLPQWRTVDVAGLAPPTSSSNVMAAEGGVSPLAPVFLWLGGACALLLRELARQVSLMRWARRASALRSPLWNATLVALAPNSPRLRKLRPLESASVSSPCTWGFVSPVLLLPAAGNHWTENERRLVLTHELAHIQRLDCLSGFIARLACAVHWYNPLVWLSAAEARRLQEQACDDRVLLSGARASDYATLLVTLGGAPNAIAGADGMGGSPLHGRVRALLRHRRRANDPRGIVALIAAMSVAALVLASLAPAARAHRVTSIAQPAPSARLAATTMPLTPRAPMAPHRANGSSVSSLSALAPLHGASEIAPVPATPPVPVTPATPAVPAAALPP